MSNINKIRWQWNKKFFNSFDNVSVLRYPWSYAVNIDQGEVQIQFGNSWRPGESEQKTLWETEFQIPNGMFTTCSYWDAKNSEVRFECLFEAVWLHSAIFTSRYNHICLPFWKCYQSHLATEQEIAQPYVALTVFLVTNSLP